ncbi:SDR family oxidoreductase [Lactiplantibacillus pentosus]|jgi:NADP-dependent 3-hydroxy acid dehydrogenase YdfG|uniref:SDR family oxidoreductase n=4 Tax=Lactiplantibacillus pentosus TaxID=1589 RepID=A0A2I0Z1A5_LACPE|nr:SDR family oxidoreductase [Lactiplantibacillus pentosus]EQM53367.1 oxidoreductase [Lactiplantibacillus plantarum EGD-AQ4]MCH4130525.1 SDR family oxidoreductase [Lactiplantibacillus sp.]CCC18028.1 short-chain dehydrogenase [Lactiplantibacillus pentosus IG1]BBM22762.1 oxidoreductase, short-chain dehydrogenase/reductase [Lactiplantibacillus plantarum]AUI78097.1 oxidoreductase [Lactiplantibacillus pentosus]
MSKKVIVITGASSGIGEATAKLLASQGNQLVLGARREARLQEITQAIENAGGEATYAVTDVTDLDSVKQLAKKAVDTYGRIDVWMNNAGLMPQSVLAEGKVTDWNRMIDVNEKGVLYGINAALGIMREQQSGHFINTSSIAGHIVGPGSAVYSATKQAVLAISEGLRQEEAQAGSNIRVTVVSPGAIATELTNSITDEEVKKGTEQFYDLFAISPERVAESIAFAINAPADASINEIIIRPSKQVM